MDSKKIIDFDRLHSPQIYNCNVMTALKISQGPIFGKKYEKSKPIIAANMLRNAQTKDA